MYNVYIRPLEIEDAKISWQWRNDKEIWKYTGTRPDKIITYEIEKEWLLRVLNEKNSCRFAIIVDEVYVGNIQLTNLTLNQAQYHIFIGNKKFWNQGIAQLATFQILMFAKESLNIKKVYLKVNVENKVAIRVYEKCGFKKSVLVNEDLKMLCSLNTLNPPMVSVFCMVYNHAMYLDDCLKGILTQKCNFNFVIVLGEDCSTDNSREIILKYNKEYPGKFNLLLHNQNIGAQKNQELLLKRCKGKYTAMCEGDDYWTDPYKLQKQVDFLETYNDYVLCFHPIKILNPDGRLVNDFITKVPNNYETIENLARLGNYIHTPSVVFRNIITNFPFEFNNSPVGDYFLYLMLAEHGKIKNLNEVMGVYRFGVGIHSVNSKINHTKSNLKLYVCLLSYLKNDKIKEIIFERYLESMSVFEHQLNAKYKDYFISKHPVFLLIKSILTHFYRYSNKIKTIVAKL